MLNTRHLPEGQDWLIDRMQALGYVAEKDGICYGLTGIYALSFARHGLAGVIALNKLLLSIHALPLEVFKEEKTKQETPNKKESAESRLGAYFVEIRPDVEALVYGEITGRKERPDNLAEAIFTLDQESKKRFDVLVSEKIEEYLEKNRSREFTLRESRSLFDGIEIFFQANLPEYAVLFEEGKQPVTQDILAAAELFKTQIGDEKEEALLSKTEYFETGIYKGEAELTQFFEIWQAQMEKEPGFDMSFVLLNSNHAISVLFDHTTKTWRFVDANQLREIGELSKNNQRIAKLVETGFDAGISSENLASLLAFSSNTAFSTEGYVKPEHEGLLAESWKAVKANPAWKTLHGVTPEKARLKDTNGASWLSIAVRKKDLALVKSLLKNDASPNVVLLGNGLTPLHSAAALGDLEMVRLLLKHGAKTNILGKDNLSVLHSAIGSDNSKVLEFLLNKTGNTLLNVENSKGVTPLLQAIHKKNKENITLLIARHPDLGLTKLGTTPLHLAVALNDVDTASALLKAHADPNLVDAKGRTALYQAALAGNLDLVKVLLENGADPNLGHVHFKDAPLAVAVEKNHTEVIGELLKHLDIDTNVLDSDGYSPLYKAVYENRVDVVKLILAKEITNPNLPNTNNTTPLLNAVLNNNMEMVNLLLENGASPNVLSSMESERNPLFVAVAIGNLVMTERLLEEGANPNLGIDEYSSLTRAVESKQIDLVELLLKNEAQVSEEDRKLAKDSPLEEIVEKTFHLQEEEKMKAIQAELHKLESQPLEKFIMRSELVDKLKMLISKGESTKILNQELANIKKIDKTVLEVIDSKDFAIMGNAFSLAINEAYHQILDGKEIESKKLKEQIKFLQKSLQYDERNARNQTVKTIKEEAGKLTSLSKLREMIVELSKLDIYAEGLKNTFKNQVGLKEMTEEIDHAYRSYKPNGFGETLKELKNNTANIGRGLTEKNSKGFWGGITSNFKESAADRVAKAFLGADREIASQFPSLRQQGAGNLFKQREKQPERISTVAPLPQPGKK